MSRLLHVQLAGQEAGRKGLPNETARGDVSEEALIWFHAWLLATVEREQGRKILVAAPPEADDLRICCPKKRAEASL